MARRLTKRQKQSRKISREKAKKKRLRTIARIGIAAGVVIVVSVTVAVSMGWLGMGRVYETVDRGKAEWYEFTSSLGFTVQHVYLDGREKTTLPQIHEALKLETGMPMFAVSVGDLRKRLEKIDRVAHADVERVLPDTLHIHISERNPVAIWQKGKTLRLVDETGAVMTDAQPKNYSHLPVIVGEDAPAHLPELFKMLLSEPELAAQVKAAVRVGERRWNLKLARGIEVKLPEKDAEAAWRELARAAREDKLFERNIRAVDLRLSDRMFIKLSPEVLSPTPSLPSSET